MMIGLSLALTQPHGGGGGAAPTLNTLTLSTPTGTAGTAGSSAIVGKTGGSTLTLTNNVGGLYSVAGSTLSWTSSVVAATDMPTIRETLAGATNTPKDTTVSVVISAASVTYLPTLSSSPFMLFGMRAMLSASAATPVNLFRLTDSAGTPVHLVVPNKGTATDPVNPHLPDYAAIATWMSGHTAPFSLDIWYDQSGNGKDMTPQGGGATFSADSTVSAPNGGIYPLLCDGQSSTSPIGGGGIQIANSMRADSGGGGFNFNRQAITIFGACEPTTSLDQNCYFMTDNGFGGGSGVIFDTVNRQLACNGGAVGSTTTMIPRAQPSFIGYYGSATETRIYARETVVTGSAMASGTTDQYLNINNGNGGNRGSSKWFGLVAYKAALSSGDITSLTTAWYAMHAIPTVFDSRILFDGNSLMHHWLNNSGAPRSMCSTPANRSTPGLSGTPEIFNLSIPGATAAAQNTGYATRGVQFLVQEGVSLYGGSKTLYIYEGGVNDGSDPTASRTALFVKVHADGCLKIGQMNLLQKGSGFAYIDTANTAVAANTAGADFNILTNSITGIAATQATAATITANTTYFQSDGLHWTKENDYLQASDATNGIHAALVAHL